MDSFLYTPRRASLPRHIVLTLLLVAGALAIGVSTNDLGVVLAFNVSSMRLLASLEFNPLSFFSLPLPTSLACTHTGLFHSCSFSLHSSHCQLPEAVQDSLVFPRQDCSCSSGPLWSHCYDAGYYPGHHSGTQSNCCTGKKKYIIIICCVLP